MIKEDLIDLLETIAQSDTEDGHNVFDHPCSVAIRALNQCFEDIQRLQAMVELGKPGRSKAAQTLIKLPYDPSW